MAEDLRLANLPTIALEDEARLERETGEAPPRQVLIQYHKQDLERLAAKAIRDLPAGNRLNTWQVVVTAEPGAQQQIWLRVQARRELPIGSGKWITDFYDLQLA